MKNRARLTAGLALVLAVVVVTTIAAATAATGGSSQTGFKTAKPQYLVPTAPGVLVDPIISTGDIVGSPTTGYQMSGIPDGLGAYRTRGGGDDDDDNGRSKNVVVVMNHELGRSFPLPPAGPAGVDTRISRLEIDRKDHSVLNAHYLFDGNEGFERFCSATLMLIGGDPYYFTGEEAVPMDNQPPGPAHDGSSIVMNPDNGMWVETAHFGHFQHENVVPLRLKKWVFLSSEDDFRPGPSYLYAYIADDFNRALRGQDGALYVWKADNDAKNQNSAVAKGESVPGHFVLIPGGTTMNSTQLKAAASSPAINGFRFDRLEDIAARPDVRGRTYIADTGKPPSTARGRVYQFDVNPRDPTLATLKMILNGDAAVNPDDIYNPDNMDASERVLMIQEDRESAFRGCPCPPNQPVDGGFARVMEYSFRNETLRSVARVATPANLRPGTWESSGIIKAFDTLGRGWWLLDVQAHSSFAPQPGATPFGREPTPNTGSGEDGQLLAMFVPNSGSNSGDDDDD